MTRHRPAHEVELYHEGDAYTVVADLPDVDPADVDVRWQEGGLSITARRKTPEGRTRVFHRTVSLPHPVDADGIEASFEDGVLEVTLPVESDARPEGRAVDVND
jgi:HSP20 family protein